MAGLWVGTSGFSYKEWRPQFYPAELKERDFLRYYASRLSSVEIDSTFYRMPRPTTLHAWREATGERFRFALKASRRITHVERLRLPSASLDYLLTLLPALGDRLGPLLVQLPPDFPKDLPRLDGFLLSLSRGARAAVEFRHPSWHDPETFDLLRSRGAALCIADTDEGTTPLEVTAPFVYVRLRRSSYEPAALGDWRRRMRVWEAGGLDVFAYVKHRDNPRAALIAEAVGGTPAPAPLPAPTRPPG